MGNFSDTNSTTHPEDDPQEKIMNLYVINLFNITFRSASVLALGIGIGIFIYFQNLCNKDNVRIHIHLFMSNLLMDISFIIEESHLQLLLSQSNSWNNSQVNESGEIEESNFEKLLTLTNYYLVVANTMWMCCEAVYLFYLIYRVWFNKEIALRIIFFLGWGVPAILLSIYTAVWLQIGKRQDWMYMWLIDYPQLIPLGFNAWVLLYIVVYLCRSVGQLPPSVMRGARALAILTPLLGVHHIMLGLIPEFPDFFILMLLKALLSSPQGLVVAIVFCFTNADVQMEVNTALNRGYSGFDSSWIRRNPRGSSTHIVSFTNALDDHSLRNSVKVTVDSVAV